MRSIAAERLDDFAGASRVEMVSRFTEPFPVYAALAIFGFPREDAQYLRNLVDGLVHGRGSDASIRASQTLTEYLTDQLKARGASADPSTDIVAAIALGELLRRYERFELDTQDSIAWGEGETPGLTRLPLFLHPFAR